MNHRLFLFRPLPALLVTAFFYTAVPIRGQLAVNLVSDTERDQIRLQTSQRTLLADQSVDAEKSRRGLTGDDTFVAAASTLDPFGELHVRYIRKYRGYRVIGEGAKAVVNRAGTSALAVPLTAAIVAPASIIPVITESAALQTVAKDLGAELAELDSTQELAILPAGPTRREARLVWSVNGDAPDAKATMYAIDAITGVILTKNPAHVYDINSTPGFGLSYYSGTVDIITRYSSAENKYKLQDTSRGDLLVYDVEDKKPTHTFHGNPYWNAANTWGNGQDWQPGDSTTGQKGQTAAVDAFYGGRRAYDTLKNIFGRTGLNDNTTDPIKLRVHVREKASELYSDAKWDGYFANFGDGAAPASGHRADPNTVAHELGHGIWTAIVTGDPHDNTGESAGLNEGHGDIMAAITNHYFGLAGGQGATVPTAGPEDANYFDPRMINPAGYDQGGSQGRPYYVDGMGNWEVHAQGCAYGHMFATLAIGAPSAAAAASMPACSGRKFSCLASIYLPQGMGGIGMHKAAQIWYRATLKFPAKPTFSSVRADFLEAASELYGADSDEYKSVMNAFHAINVGAQAVDTANPGISLGVPVVDDEEQSVRFSATGSDDIGVLYVEMSLPGISKIVNRNPAAGYIDLDGSPYGKKDLIAKAYDAAGKMAQTSREISYDSANFLINNRGFENWNGNWDNSSTNLFKNKASDAFLGSKYVGFSSNSYIRQQFSAPAGATNCRIGYRVRVDPKMGDSAPLLVELLNSSGASVLQTLNTIQPTTSTIDWTSNNYKRYTHVLNDCAGLTRWIRFRTTTSDTDFFRLDNVFVTYTANPSGDFQVSVDEAERTVIFEMKNIQHIQPADIDRIEFGSPGVTPWKDFYAPYLRVDLTSDYVLNGTYFVNGAIVNQSGVKVYQSPTLPFVVHPVNQVLNNPGLESQGAFWTNTGAGGWCPPIVVGTSASSFTGVGCALFTGNGSIYQQVSLPNGPGQAQLTFRLRIQNGNSQQRLHVEVVDLGNGAVTELDNLSGGDSTYAGGITHNGYKKFTFNMAPFLGKTIRVRFRSTNSSVLPMEFYLDNTGLTYNIYGIAQ